MVSACRLTSSEKWVPCCGDRRPEGRVMRQGRLRVEGRAVVSFSFHREPVFSGPFHRPFFIWRNVSRLRCHSASFSTLSWSVSKWQLLCHFLNLSPEFSFERFKLEQHICNCTASKQMQIVAFYFDCHAYLLFECACFGIFCHYIVQCLYADVDDATEPVLDHANTQTQTH